jgi:hypothetical protein
MDVKRVVHCDERKRLVRKRGEVLGHVSTLGTHVGVGAKVFEL